MGRMKDIYTEMHTQESLTNSANEYLAENIKNLEEKDNMSKFEDLPEHMKEIIRAADVHREFKEAVQQKFQHAQHILLSKHKDYGPTNISLSPGGPLNGLRVRMWDKFARINHLIDTGAKPEHESLRDSFLDMANYAIIAMLVLDDEWDKGK
jgi:hypothetical protein